MALASFGLGYIHQVFARQLVAVGNPPLSSDTSMDSLAEKCQFYLRNESQSRALARRHYRDAYASFKQVNHLLGMLLAKQHETELFPNSASDADQRKAKKKVEKLQKRFLQYCKEHGINKSCHIPRESGADISIMTEIVYHNVR